MSFQAEILVIGAGAGGLAAARALADKGKDVLVLEQGHAPGRTNLPTANPNWQTLDAANLVVSGQLAGKDTRTYSIDASESDIAPIMHGGVGGSTLFYSAHFPRLLGQDLITKRYDGVGSDWPIDFDTLTNYYNKLHEFVPIAGLNGDPFYPDMPPLLPPVPLGLMGELIGYAFNSLGWHWWPAYAAIATRQFGGHSPCINIGPCNLGCPQGAKATADSVFLHNCPPNLRLMTGYQVLRLETSAKGSIETAIVVGPDGAQQRFNASIFVLAANAIGTPRILLNSRNTRFPNGLGNNHGLVGRNLMMHPLGYVEATFPEKVDSHLGPQGCVSYSHQFYGTQDTNDFIRGYMLQVLRGPAPVESAKSAFLRRQLPMGREHVPQFLQRFDHTAHIAVVAEDLPEAENRVELDTNKIDSFGFPGIRVKYRVTPNTKRILKQGLKSAQRLLQEAGGRDLLGFAPVRNTGWHLMGTCRMGQMNSDSVTDKFGKVHGTTNLYISDGSLMPTVGTVNPAATIMALGLYVADNIG